MSERQQAVVRNWRVDEDGCIAGTVVSHPRIPVGHRVKTSQIVVLDREDGTCETLNTTYRLDGPELTGKPEAVVRDWWFVGGPGRKIWRLCGELVSHPTVEPGIEMFRSSPVKNLDRSAGICETANTAYRLDGPEKTPTEGMRRLMIEMLACDEAVRMAWALGRDLDHDEHEALLRRIKDADRPDEEEEEPRP